MAMVVRRVVARGGEVVEKLLCYGGELRHEETDLQLQFRGATMCYGDDNYGGVHAKRCIGAARQWRSAMRKTANAAATL